ncbi:MAG: hypothetical protein ACHQEB_03870 [Chitinophagales bacterium]
MLTGLPSYVTIVFLLTVVLTFILFLSASKKKSTPAIIILIWLALSGLMAYKGFFQNTKTIPPKMAFIMAPAIVFVILLLVTRKGKTFTDNLDLKMLTLLHIIRIPVELVLYWLAANKFIPELMTFAGRNFDIISGITAPVMYMLCFRNSQLKHKMSLLLWNFICLALLLNIIVDAVLSAPFPFQLFAFDQPNVAILYFPFTWLPCFIVIVVLLSHLVAIRRLLKKS